jgi:hypothetical protein
MELHSSNKLVEWYIELLELPLGCVQRPRITEVPEIEFPQLGRVTKVK